MPYVGNRNTVFTTFTTSDANVTDDLTVTDDASVGGDLTITGTTTLTGNVGIGTSSVDVSTQAGGSGYKAVQIESDEGGQLNFDHNDAGTGSTLGQLNFQRAGEVVAEMEGVTDGATDSGKLGFRTQATGGALTARMTISSGGDIDVETGDIFFSTADKGIVLGATSNTDANTLHDYEEGTWTPRITASTAGVATPTSDNGGTYVKVGDMVTLNFGIYWDAVTTTMDGSRRISGLPFSSANITGNQAGNFMGPHYNGMLQSGHLNFMALPTNVNYIEVLSVNSDGTNNASGHNYDHSDMSMPTAGNMTSLSLVYRAA